jgi:hypothetical protein
MIMGRECLGLLGQPAGLHLECVCGVQATYVLPRVEPALCNHQGEAKSERHQDA